MKAQAQVTGKCKVSLQPKYIEFGACCFVDLNAGVAPHFSLFYL